MLGMDLDFHFDNLAKHNVSTDEVEEALADSNGWTQKARGGAYLHLGKTEQGRLLELAFRRLPDGSAFIFHAMDARDSQKKRYKKRS